ncbi:MAG TPA: hypothetical protein VM942_03650 [Acidimicrobiales bacterium]|nr:hypothetical protein [Acidimicrobiales bacterium]
MTLSGVLAPLSVTSSGWGEGAADRVGRRGPKLGDFLYDLNSDDPDLHLSEAGG